MAKDRNSEDSALGWQFQVDCAIVLALSELENIEFVNIEGLYEDVEIYRKGGAIDFVQAKLMSKPNLPERAGREGYSRQIRAKLSKALDSLKDAIGSPSAARADEVRVFFMTNALYPLGNFEDAPWMGFEALMYADLSGAAIEYLDKVMRRKRFPIDKKANFGICTLPYTRPTELLHSDSDEPMPHCPTLAYITQSFLDKISHGYNKYERYLYFIRSKSNYSATNKKMHLTREDFVWPAVVLKLSFVESDYKKDNIELYDEEEIQRIETAYDSIISFALSRFPLISNVCDCFEKYKDIVRQKGREEAIKLFADENISIIKNEFPEAGDDLNAEEFDSLCRYILIRIITNEFSIKKAKKVFSLQ